MAAETDKSADTNTAATVPAAGAGTDPVAGNPAKGSPDKKSSSAGSESPVKGPVKGPAKAAATGSGRRASQSDPLELEDRLPVKMMADRVLVSADDGEGDRTSTGGILIPATAQVGKRLRWARVRAVGPNVRNVEAGDQVLFHPDDTFDAEVRGHSYLILRERDLHAVAAERLAAGSTGLYL